MNNQNIIVYRFSLLYQILKELEEDIQFKIIEVSDEKALKNEIKDLKNYLIITKTKILKINNQFILNQLPIKIFKMIEKLSIELLKHQFIEQSKFIINDYTIDINAREMSSKNGKLKLTEKEVNTIIYLSKVNKPISINELQTKVWDYHSDIETHTVETHIYRLRKKIFKNFLDDNFIISKNNGYQIK
jgi:DNA-binding response OmpR family regulator